MRERIHAFVQGLRARGLEVSVAETLDAVAAVAAAGVDRPVLREALAATLVKDEGDRPAFDTLFDEMFPALGPPAREGRRKRRAAASGTGAPGGRRGRGDGTSATALAAPDDARPRDGRQPMLHRLPPSEARRGTTVARDDGERLAGTRLGRRRRLLALPFAEFTDRDVAEARDLVRDLGARLRGRLARRMRRAGRGRLDFRRTIRAALGTGGALVRPAWRARRPGRPDLVALCDLSGSVAAASELLLGLLAPAAAYFRRVHLYAYVDRLVPVSIERGHVAPGAPLDLHARSDFGRVLGDLWREAPAVLTRSTVLLVLGDARNNRLPPRADLLRAARDRVGRVVWLVPEPRARWNTGDSVLTLYAPACDAVVECVDLAGLVGAVRAAL